MEIAMLAAEDFRGDNDRALVKFLQLFCQSDFVGSLVTGSASS